METKEQKAYKLGRFMYILEAGFEYLISILVAGSFLATITGSLGISDSLTGIISSFISLGCLFQLLSLFLRRKRMKTIVIILSVINQILFLLLYLIPLWGGGQLFKKVAFVVAIFTAYIIYNFAHPKKINWLMSLVDDHQRGSFTANKEIISLISGMIFQFVMGAVFDSFKAKGEIKTAFIIAAAVMFSLMIAHTLSMFFAVEKEILTNEKKNLIKTIKEIAGNKDILKITLVFILYNAANYSSISFHGTYQINELGFSLKLISFIAITGSVSRILFSRFWGKYADKRSFSNMIEKCFIVLGIGYLCYVFATPKTGIYAVIGYTLLHGIAMGGINSALTNLVFDYVTPDKRSDSLAICQAASGVVGFVSTLLVSPLVSYIQNSSNTFLGIPIYAQQVLSILSCILTVVAIIYVRTVLIKKR